jgi:hypothetical protein
MVVEEGCDGCLKEVVEEGARGCVGACWISDVAVEVACANFMACGVLKVK